LSCFRAHNTGRAKRSETGLLTPDNCVVTLINPRMARSQVISGMALLEHTMTDRHSGRIVNADLANYLAPVNADIADLDAIFVEEDDPYVNPLGVKGVGELALVGVAPAVANAVFHATGKRVRELPITPDKLL